MNINLRKIEYWNFQDIVLYKSKREISFLEFVPGKDIIVYSIKKNVIFWPENKYYKNFE